MKKNNLFPVLMVNSFLWALTIIVVLIILKDTPYYMKLFPVLAGGTTVSIVAVTISWNLRKQVPAKKE